LVVEVESIEAKRARLRQWWGQTLLMQASPEAAKAERAAWQAYSNSLLEVP